MSYCYCLVLHTVVLPVLFNVTIVVNACSVHYGQQYWVSHFKKVFIIIIINTKKVFIITIIRTIIATAQLSVKITTEIKQQWP